MKDDYGLDANYSYDDEEEWGDDEAAWTAEEEQEEEPTDAKDESTAYLEFLNEEASLSCKSDARALANDMTGTKVRSPRGTRFRR